MGFDNLERKFRKIFTQIVYKDVSVNSTVEGSKLKIIIKWDGTFDIYNRELWQKFVEIIRNLRKKYKVFDVIVVEEHRNLSCENFSIKERWDWKELNKIDFFNPMILIEIEGDIGSIVRDLEAELDKVLLSFI